MLRVQCRHSPLSLPTQALEKMLRAHLGVKALLTRADNIIGSVVVHGNHKDKAVVWLKTMGF